MFRQSLVRCARAASVALRSNAFSSTSGVPTTMRAAVIRETGPAEVMKVEKDYPTPALKAGQVSTRNNKFLATDSTEVKQRTTECLTCGCLGRQVLIRNQFAGINFIDTYHRSGLYARDLPFVGGQEGGGYIAALSDEAKAMVSHIEDQYGVHACVACNV